MEKYNVYIKKFKIAVSILAGAIVILGILVARLVPEIQKVISIQDETKTQASALSDAERKLENLKQSAAAKKEESSNILKAFFKPISTGLDTEGAISDEFAEVAQVMRDNKIKARSIKYDYDPQDDNFVKNAGSKYHVCRITAELIANYSNFEGFLRELYKHDHFLEISKIEILPYQKNKKILLISTQIKLYAQRDPSSIVATPAPQPEAAPTEKAPEQPAAQEQQSSDDI